MNAHTVLSEEQKRAFIEDGYIILPGIVPDHLIDTARSFADRAFAEGRYARVGPTRDGSVHPVAVFHVPVKKLSQITNLLFETGIPNVVEQILGNGNALFRDEGMGQIAYTETDELFAQKGMASSRPHSMASSRPHSKHRWHIDSGAGKYSAFATGFLLLVGVALSPGQHIDENRGQFTVWPEMVFSVCRQKGSHLVTHPALAEIVHSNPAASVMEKWRVSKDSLHCGKPKRVLLRPGDAFIAHQRLAHAAGVNLCKVTRKNVYFRVMHVRHNEVVYQCLRSPTPWAGFEGMREQLPAESTSYAGDPERNYRMAMRRMLAALPVAMTLSEEARSKLSLTLAQKKSFIKEGYLVLRGIVDESMVHSVLTFVNKAYAEGKFHTKDRKGVGSRDSISSFYVSVLRAPQIVDLFLKTGLVDICEELLGKDNVVVLRNAGDISFNGTSDISFKKTMDTKDPHPIDKGLIQERIEEFLTFEADCSTLLVGVALSEGQDVDENRGQVTVWPGSHFDLHKVLSSMYGKNGTEEGMLPSEWSGKLDCAQPRRLLLHPGDVFIAHQRLLHSAGINLTDVVRKNVHFRVSQAEFEDIADDFVRGETPFTGFEGIHDIIEGYRQLREVGPG